MKNFYKKYYHLIIFLGVGVFGFQNCSQSPFGKIGFQIDDSLSIESNGNNIVTVPYALLTGEQLLKSMASTTGVEITPQISTEYSKASSTFAGSTDLKVMTSSMMINATNLASQFCSESLTQTTVKGKLYSEIDFSKGILGSDGSPILDDDKYEQAVESLGRSFWGRSPSSEEKAIIYEAKNEFVNEFSDTEKKDPTATQKLMLFTCTALLVSFDAISF